MSEIEDLQRRFSVFHINPFLGIRIVSRSDDASEVALVLIPDFFQL